MTAGTLALTPSAAASVAAEGCSATRHGSTEHAWRRNGCRCPGAQAAHDAYQITKREQDGRRWARFPQTNAECPSRRHAPNNQGWLRGCRCDGAVAARQAWLDRQWRHAVGRAERRLRSAASERARWRGPASAVNLNNLIVLKSGVPDEPTVTEKVLAAMWLARRGMDNIAIGERLGVTEKRVTEYLRRFAELRRSRTQRRLADARWRSARNDLIAVRSTGPERAR